MKSVISGLLVALSMYSAIPVPQVNWEKQTMRWALGFLPLIGVLIGAIEWFWFAFCVHFGAAGVFYAVIAALIPLAVSGGIHLFDEISAQGRDLTQFVTDFIWYLRSLLLVQTGADAEEALDMSAENLAVLKKEAQEGETDTLLRYIRVFSELSGQMRSASSKRVLLDVALIRMMKPFMSRTS